jgi:integrase
LHASKRVGWSAQYAARWIERMEKDLFPWIGTMPLPKITAPLLLQVLRRVEARGARETSHTLRQTAGQVFRHGIATGRGERNPAGDLQGALQPVTVKHMAAVLDEHAAGHLMRAIHAYQGQPTTRGALLLSALTFQRPANVRMMEWSEIDTDERMWAIPAAKMKRRQDGKINGRPHFVPLAQQALEALEELRPITGHGRYVFPGLHDHERPMSENTVNLALRRMGFSAEEMTAHGFRSMARTIMVERTGVPADVIEAQLAHGKSGPLGSAYDRADFMAQRREMMTTWAEYLARIRIGAQVLPLKKA